MEPAWGAHPPVELPGELDAALLWPSWPPWCRHCAPQPPPGNPQRLRGGRSRRSSRQRCGRLPRTRPHTVTHTEMLCRRGAQARHAERARVQGQTQRGQRRAGNRAAHLGVESPCRCAPACRLRVRRAAFISTLEWAPNAHSAHVPHPAESNRRVSCVLAHDNNHTNQPSSAPSRLATLLR